MMFRSTLLAVGLALVATAPPVCAEEKPSVTIERVQWGFDGKVQERTFVPLSVLVRNHTPLEFEGTLALTKLVQTTKPIDASIHRDVYIGPLTARWVQFVPFVISDWEQWRLTWGHAADENFDIPTPAMGERATVLLYDPDDLQFAGGVLRRFPDNLFPVSVTATEGLRGVAMDRPPRWQGARRQAFLDWLTLGGRVYLLQDEQGRFPTFPQSLDVLNGRGDRYLVGVGVVERIPRTVRSLEPEFVKDRILTDPANNAHDQRMQQFRQSPGFRGSAPLLNRTGWDRDTQMFLDLQTIARFSRQWWVIYGLALMYLLCLFPLCYRVGREAKDYRWTYLVLLAAVGTFSYGFASLSRLGASEVSRARAVAVARELRPGLFDVTQWTCLAVREAGEFAVEHGGTGRLYSTSQDMERIEGSITAGPSARMNLEIPPASTRTVLHRTRLEAAPLEVSVGQSASDERGLSALAVRVGPNFPAEPMIILAAHDGNIFEMKRLGEQLRLVPSTRRPILTFLTDYFQIVLTTNAMPSTAPRLEEDSTEQEVYREALRTLVGNSFGLSSVVDPTQLKLDSSLVRLFVYAPMPQSFQVAGESFPDQDGYVLYVADLPLRIEN